MKKENPMLPCANVIKNDGTKITQNPGTPKPEPLTKVDKIRAHLLSGQSITPLTALKLYGSFCLKDVIFDLRKEGMDIRTDMTTYGPTGSRFAKYTLKTNQDGN